MAKNAATLIAVMTFVFIANAQNFNYTAYIHKVDNFWYFDSLTPLSFYTALHSRVDLEISETKYDKLTKFWRFEVALRSKLIYSNFGNLFGISTANLLPIDKGMVDLSYSYESKQKDWVFWVNLDRLNFSYGIGDFEIVLGRQRINWSRSLVWNPNDIFNSYFFMELDNPEGYSVDGIDFRYSGVFVGFEWATVRDRDSNWISAARMEANLGRLFLQFLGGYYKDSWLIGSGWEWAVDRVMARGEVSYLLKDDILVASGDFDVMFGENFVSLVLGYNSLGAEVLDRILGTESFAGFVKAPSDFYYTLTAKYNVGFVAQVKITELFSLNFTGVRSVERKGNYVFLTGNFSLSDNMDLDLTAQYTEFYLPFFEQLQKFDFYGVFLRFSYNF